MIYLILLFTFVNVLWILTHFSWDLLNENFCHLSSTSKKTNTSTNEDPAFLSAKIVSTLSKVMVSDHSFLTDSLWGWVMAWAAGGCQQCPVNVNWLTGLPLITPQEDVIFDVFVCLFSLKLCTVCSVHYRLQQEVEDSSSAAHRPGLWSHSHDGRPSTWPNTIWLFTHH